MEFLFGPGDTDFPRWLLAVRLDIVVFLVAALALLGRVIGGLRREALGRNRADLGLALSVTAVGAALRFGVVEHNLSALGGIGYSRILLGYKGHFGTAQLYSLVYAWSGRDLEHAILLNRMASTLTVPLVYALCRRLAPGVSAFAPIAAALLALQPLHLLFTATDGLPISSSLLAAASYLLLVISVGDAGAAAWARVVSAVGAAAGLALLTQIRQENVLFLVPPAVYVLAQRRAVSFRLLAPGALVFALFISVFVFEAMGAGVSQQTAGSVADGLRAAAREVFSNSIYGIGPVLIGTAAAMVARRSRVRWLVPLPVLALAPLIALAIAVEGHDYSVGFVPLARIYTNQVLLLTLVAAYGVALFWESPRWVPRLLAAGCLLWASALPVLFWPNLRERYLEIAEHDFFRAALASLPPGVDRIVVPDDERLFRESHSTIELMTKYRMIASAGAQAVELVEMTRFLQHPRDVDCSRGNCLFFRGLPCMGSQRYWFAEAQCAQLMVLRAGPPLREEELESGSFLDCSLYRGEARRQRCEPARAQRFGLYRIARQP